MNLVFIIDNSISMRQRSYCGISLCEVAKNGIEFIMKQRLRSSESKGDSYHLLQSGFDIGGRESYSQSMQVLSSFKHDLAHFFFQLKNIRTHAITDLPGTLQTAYHMLNTFRFLNGADNINGGRDAMKSDPSMIILFTDVCDYFQLERMQDLVRAGRMHNTWDQNLFIFQLRLPSFIEKGIVSEEMYGIQSQMSSPSTNMLGNIANALGGVLLLAESQEHLFQQADSQIIPLFAKTRLCLLLQSQCRCDPDYPGFVDSGIKEIHNPIQNPLLPSKDIALLKFLPKTNKQFQQVKQKAEIQNHQYSRVLMPDKPARIESQELRIAQYPKFVVNFGKIFHANMNKDIEFEKQEMELGEWSRLIAPYLVPFIKEKAYFPLFASAEPLDDTQLGISQVIVGLLKVNCRDGEIIGIDMLFNIWNFIEFNLLYEDMIARKAMLQNAGAQLNSIASQIDQELGIRLERYCFKTPFYYLPTIRKILQEKGLQSLVEKKQNFMYADALLKPDFQEFCRQLLKFKSKERKKMDEAAKQNKIKHANKMSVCCAMNSENYESLNRGMHPKSLRKMQLENLLLMKEEVLSLRPAQKMESDPIAKLDHSQLKMPDWEDCIRRVTFKSEPVAKMSELFKPARQTEIREVGVDDDEIKIIKEPLPFGNPFKIVARIKNARVLMASPSNELIASEENYISNNLQQQNLKNSANLLLNRLPKLRKLKTAEGNELKKKIKPNSESLLLNDEIDNTQADEEVVVPLLYDDFAATLPSYSEGGSTDISKKWKEDETLADDEDEEDSSTNTLLKENLNIGSSQSIPLDEKLSQNGERRAANNIKAGVEQEELDDEEQEPEYTTDEPGFDDVEILSPSHFRASLKDKKDSKNKSDGGYDPDENDQSMQHISLEKVKKYAYTDLVYRIRQDDEHTKLNESIEEEYNPECVQDAKQSVSTVKIEFSTKYLLSPLRKQQEFLLSQKEFFQQLLLVQQTYSRNDLKLYVQSQLKKISDHEYLEIFKQRVSDIVYIDKPTNLVSTS